MIRELEVMNVRRILIVTVSAFVLGAPMVGGTYLVGGMATASGKFEGPDAKMAGKEAKAARSALKRGNGQMAVTHAEAAVAFDPKNGELRELLGEAYLFAGRFISAAQALNEALSLDPGNGRIALNLALAQVATGEWTTARQTLDTYATSIPATDRGLAMALAGDPNGAIAVLGDAARQPGADAKTRQNLALSLALAGEWQQAKIIAAADLAPDQVDARIMHWASFSRPQNAYDQVAQLLGVTPVADEGRPERLALGRPMSVAVVAQQAVDPVDSFMPNSAGADQVTAIDVVQAGSVDGPTGVDAMPAIAPFGGAQISFAPLGEIVQAVPVTRPTSAVSPKRAARAAVADKSRFVQADGPWFVQLGAYDSSAVARDAWRRAVKRVAALEGMTPSNAAVTTPAGSFQRLAVGGFSRASANALCRDVRASGGACFVRVGAGDSVASWAKSTQFASR